MRRIVCVGLLCSFLAVNAAAAQPEAPAASALPLTVDRASLAPERGVLTIHGTGLGPDVVVTMGHETLPLLAGATSEQVEALAPSRVLTTSGTYRISVVDRVRGTETAFVVVSQPTTDGAAEGVTAGGLSRGAAREVATTAGTRPAKAADVSAGGVGAAGNGPSPQLIEDATLFNTAVGVLALTQNLIGPGNTAAGYAALFSNTNGSANVASGAHSLQENTTGSLNTATGYWASVSNTTGFENTADGFAALYSNTTGSQNVAAGARALYENTTGSSNTAVGYQALHNNTADANLAIGRDALLSNTSGFFNSASGAYSLSSNTTGTENTAHGYAALYLNATGYSNVANGAHALYNVTDGSRNAAVGDQALIGNVNGSDNTAIGYRAGWLAGGSHNVYVGANVEGTVNDANTMRLGAPFNGSAGTGQSKTFIAGIYSTPLTSPAQLVYVDANGQLGTVPPTAPPGGYATFAVGGSPIPTSQVMRELAALRRLLDDQQAMIEDLRLRLDRQKGAASTKR